MAEAKWYVVHTYSGYENKVKSNIEKTVENRGIQDQILDVCIPLEEVIETNEKGIRNKVLRKTYPGYVFINMVYNDDVWHVVKNTQGVTGFVGPESTPIPLTDAEIKSLGLGEEAVQAVFVDVDFEEGDNIVVISGPYTGTQGVIKSINHSKRTLKFSADNIIGGASTIVEIGFNAVKVERF